MKNFILLILVFSFFSCVEGETNNIWDDLTPAQQAALKVAAKNRCVNSYNSAFTNIENYTRSESLLFKGDLTVTYRVFSKDYEDTTGPDDDDEEISSQIIYSFEYVGISNDVITYNVKKVDKAVTSYKIITHNFAINTDNGGTINTDLNAHWDDEIIDRVCDPDSEFSLVGNVGARLTYQRAVVDTDNTTEKISYSDVFTIYNRYPVFFEYFNRTRTETKLRRSDNKSLIVKRTWVISENIDAFTLPGGTTTCSFSDEADLAACLNF